MEAKAISTQSGELSQPITFQLDRIIVVEIIDADHPVAALKQTLGQGHANEAGGSGDQNVGHCLNLS